MGEGEGERGRERERETVLVLAPSSDQHLKQLWVISVDFLVSEDVQHHQTDLTKGGEMERERREGKKEGKRKRRGEE